MEAAIQGRQWNKAIQILQMQDPDKSGHYYKLIAEHFISVKDYKQAETFYSKAGLKKEIMDMYLQADQWEQAYQHAQICMSANEIRVLYIGKAKELDKSGKHREAEKLYLLVNEPDLAINMYRRAKQHEAVIRLTAISHKDLLDDIHITLAKVGLSVTNMYLS